MHSGMKELLAVFEGHLQMVSPAFIVWVLALLVTGLSNGTTPELGNLSSSPLSLQFRFFKLKLVFIMFTTLASSMGNPGHELGKCIWFNPSAWWLAM